LEELERIGEEHRPQFLHRAWGFDLDKFFTQVNRIRSALPEDIKAASRVAQERQQILETAEAERERLLAEAREQAALLVSNDEIVRRATEQAEEVIQRATAEAAEIRHSAEEYATRALANLEEYVTRVLTAVRSARQRLGQAPTEQETED
jgi:regulator of protease activity HflC (stomatin/prohibitin superfamily)